jgi:hypothetical protein
MSCSHIHACVVGGFAPEICASMVFHLGLPFSQGADVLAVSSQHVFRQLATLAEEDRTQIDIINWAYCFARSMDSTFGAFRKLTALFASVVCSKSRICVRLTWSGLEPTSSRAWSALSATYDGDPCGIQVALVIMIGVRRCAERAGHHRPLAVDCCHPLAFPRGPLAPYPRDMHTDITRNCPRSLGSQSYHCCPGMPFSASASVLISV